MPTKERARRPVPAFAPTPILFCFAGGIAATFLLLLFFSWLFTKTQVPGWWAVPLATGAVCVGSFVSGSMLARAYKKNGLFCGLCAGLAFYLLFLAAALFNGQFDFTALAAIKLVCFVLAGCFGGYLAIVRLEHKNRVRRTK